MKIPILPKNIASVPKPDKQDIINNQHQGLSESVMSFYEPIFHVL